MKIYYFHTGTATINGYNTNRAQKVSKQWFLSSFDSNIKFGRQNFWGQKSSMAVSNKNLGDKNLPCQTNQILLLYLGTAVH